MLVVKVQTKQKNINKKSLNPPLFGEFSIHVDMVMV